MSEGIYIVILAGGGGQRMGGVDKGLLELGGRRFIDIVIARAGKQFPDGPPPEILISGTHDYGLDVPVINDDKNFPSGPVAGLFSAAQYLYQNAPHCKGFFTLPVDGPVFPKDLCERLQMDGVSAVAGDVSGIHPVYGWWRQADLVPIWRKYDEDGVEKPKTSQSMKALVRACGAKTVYWEGADNFININRPEDLAGLNLKPL